MTFHAGTGGTGLDLAGHTSDTRSATRAASLGPRSQWASRRRGWPGQRSRPDSGESAAGVADGGGRRHFRNLCSARLLRLAITEVGMEIPPTRRAPPPGRSPRTMAAGPESKSGGVTASRDSAETLLTIRTATLGLVIREVGTSRRLPAAESPISTPFGTGGRYPELSTVRTVGQPPMARWTFRCLGVRWTLRGSGPMRTLSTSGIVLKRSVG
jgi:hypothetical protein